MFQIFLVISILASFLLSLLFVTNKIFKKLYQNPDFTKIHIADLFFILAPMFLSCWTFIGFIFTVSLTAGAADNVLVNTNLQSDTIHFEFSGPKQWSYDIQKNERNGKTTIEVSILGLSIDAIQNLKNLKSDNIKSIQIENGIDNKKTIVIELNKKDFDVFDYLTDQPNRLIVDIYSTKTKEDSNKNSAPKDNKSKTNLVEKTVKPELNTDRHPASDLLQIDPSQNKTSALIGTFDGGDPNFDRFLMKDHEIKEDSIIAAQEKVYIDFPMLRVRSPYYDHLMTYQPIYEITPKESEENKQARLLLTLFKNNRYHVFIKTLGWFQKKFPESEYNEMLQFMLADTLYSLWLKTNDISFFDNAMVRYKQAIEKFPNSTLSERTQMFIGFSTMERGDYLGAVRSFETYLKNSETSNKNSPNKEIARLGLADAYVKLNKLYEALEEYSKIEKETKNDKYKIIVSYLKGDILFQQKKYEDAIQSYQTAIKNYPQALNEYPGAIFNQALAYFRLKEFKNTLTKNVDFLRLYPKHEYAPYALTRIGETLDILGADRSKVVGAYLENYFRFGDKPTGVVARLRLLSEKMAGMKEKEVEKLVSDIHQLSLKSDLPKIQQFATLMISDGYSKRKEFIKSTDLLIKFYQENPTTADTQLLTQQIIKNINSEIQMQVDNGNFLKALQTHNKFVDNWLKSSHRIDTKFNVARAFEQAGVFTESQLLYRDTLNKVFAIKGTKAAKEKGILENLPSEDEVHLRLSAVEYQLGHSAEALNYLNQIKNPLKMEEKLQIERVRLAAALLEKKGDALSAKRYLSSLLQEWKGIPVLLADPYLDLAQIEFKEGKKKDALESLNHIDILMQDSGKVPADTHAKALEMTAQIYDESKDTDRALKAYEKLLDKYEKQKPMDSVRYRVGKIYFDKGDIKKASEAWEPLKEKKNTFWAKLAKEQLDNANWNGDYKKYIQRIPAMSERK